MDILSSRNLAGYKVVIELPVNFESKIDDDDSSGTTPAAKVLVAGDIRTQSNCNS